MMAGTTISTFALCFYISSLLIGCMCFSKTPSVNFKTNIFNHYNSLILPDGKETTIYLLKDITKRYYFAMEENTTGRFSITVIPCDVPIEWSILHYKASHVTHAKIQDYYRANDDLKSHSYYKTASALFHYKGNSVENYVGVWTYSSSLFMLQFLSTERDTHISVYLTTDLEHGNLFPDLPGDPRIDVTAINHNSVHLIWKPSPSALKKTENIEYCLLVNEKHNYKSLCAADTSVRSVGEKWPKISTLPVSQYLDEHQRFMLLSKRESNTINKSNNIHVRQICIGNKNTYRVANLTANTQYYFDVFVVNLLTNASAAYTGTFAKTMVEPVPKITQLKDGKIVQINFDSKKQKLYSCQYQAKHKKVQFTFQACRGQVRVQILKNGKLLISETIQGLRHITIKGKVMDNYLTTLKSAENKINSSVMVQASSHIHKPLFPFFPDNLKIKSFNKLRTCDSITIAWLGTQERSMYCVYKKKIKEDQALRELSSLDRCSGPEVRPKSEKVSCKYFHDINLQRAVTTETINGLEKGTSYMIDVYLVGSPGIPVRYQSKVIKTRKSC
ncbi:protein NDNF-like [Rhinophrynus dorsalis]